MRSRVFRPHAFILAAALGLAGLSAHANLVANGDFESGDFNGWTVTEADSDISFVGVDEQAPNTGSFEAFFGSSAPSSISQTIGTTTGQTYDVSFALANSNYLVADTVATNSFDFAWSGASVVSLTNQSFGDYVLYDYQLVAAGSTASLAFTFQNPSAFWNLDSVDVEAVAAVPEPSTFCLAGLGIGALWLRTRKNRTAASAGVTSPDVAA